MKCKRIFAFAMMMTLLVGCADEKSEQKQQTPEQSKQEQVKPKQDKSVEYENNKKLESDVEVKTIEPEVRIRDKSLLVKKKKLKDTYKLKTNIPEKNYEVKNVTVTLGRWDLQKKGLKIKLKQYNNYCTRSYAMEWKICVASNQSVEDIVKKNDKYFEKEITYCDKDGNTYKAALFYKDNNCYALYNTGKKHHGHYIMKIVNMALEIDSVRAPFPSYVTSGDVDCDIRTECEAGISWVENHVFNIHTFDEVRDYYETYLSDMVHISETKQTITVSAGRVGDFYKENTESRISDNKVELDFKNKKISIYNNKGKRVSLNGSNCFSYMGKCKNKFGSIEFAFDDSSSNKHPLYVIKNGTYYLWNSGKWIKSIVKNHNRVMGVSNDMIFKKEKNGKFYFELLHSYLDVLSKSSVVRTQNYIVQFDKYGRHLQTKLSKSKVKVY